VLEQIRSNGSFSGEKMWLKAINEVLIFKYYSRISMILLLEQMTVEALDGKRDQKHLNPYR
jgi:hypothetical protein